MIRTPAAFAASTATTDSTAERCWTWIRASSKAAIAASRAIIVDSEIEGTPPIPSAAETAPSCIEPPAESSGSSSCSAIGRSTRRWY